MGSPSAQVVPAPPSVTSMKALPSREASSTASLATRWCHRVGTVRKLNRVLANIYTRPLDLISVNPFVNLWVRSRLEMLRMWTVGALMVIIRIVPMIFFILLACLLAKIFLAFMTGLRRLNRNSEPLRLLARDICFAIMRVAFFFGGFYWIRVIDYRRDKSRLAPIIPVAPHSSFFDILIILKLKRPTFVSKAENQNVPLIGNLLRLCNGIYVDRGDKNSRHKTIAEIQSRASNGEQVLIFPEGTCANRTSLVQFKLGAFIPKLPVQPVLLRWDAGDHMDSVTWSWEGPGAGLLFLNALTRISTNLEITILPEYAPNAEEKAKPSLFAENVSRLMCHDLGVLQAYYSYDDVPLNALAKDLRLFRSPVCICLLKLCYRIGQKKAEFQQKVANDTSTASNEQNKQMTALHASMPLLAVRTGGILGVGEDVEHAKLEAEHYVPKNFPLFKDNQGLPLPVLLERDAFLAFCRDKPLSVAAEAAPGTQEEFQYLPISGARRRLADKSAPPLSAKSAKSTQLYGAFSQFIEHALTHLEATFTFRLIESTEDLIELLDLEAFVRSQCSDEVVHSLRLSSIFLDILRTIEHSVGTPVTTGHLLVVLHLCDLREHDLWARLETAVRLLDNMRTAGQSVKFNVPNELLTRDGTQVGTGLATGRKTTSRTSAIGSECKSAFVNLAQLRTLLWYALGLQDFNDQFFAERQFDFPHLRARLGKVFRRSVVENACQLLE